MGATLVKLAIARAAEAGIRHDSFRVLVQMALIALDTQNKKGEDPNLYFGGHIQLALALGYGAGGRPAADSDGALKAVQRAVRPLVQSGVVQVSRARARYPAVYDLTPLRTPAPPGHTSYTRKRRPMSDSARHALSSKDETRRPAERGRVVHLRENALSTPREEPSRNHQEPPLRSVR